MGRGRIARGRGATGEKEGRRCALQPSARRERDPARNSALRAPWMNNGSRPASSARTWMNAGFRSLAIPSPPLDIRNVSSPSDEFEVIYSSSTFESGNSSIFVDDVRGRFWILGGALLIRYTWISVCVGRFAPNNVTGLNSDIVYELQVL
jgi:hypothetical protein